MATVWLPALLVLLFTGIDGLAQKAATDYDVRHYKIGATLTPSAQSLKAVTAVTFVPSYFNT